MRTFAPPKYPVTRGTLKLVPEEGVNRGTLNQKDIECVPQSAKFSHSLILRVYSISRIARRKICPPSPTLATKMPLNNFLVDKASVITENMHNKLHFNFRILFLLSRLIGSFHRSSVGILSDRILSVSVNLYEHFSFEKCANYVQFVSRQCAM